MDHQGFSHAVTKPAIIVIKPVTICHPPVRRAVQLRVSAPLAGSDLPVVIFSHGFQLSSEDYTPLIDHWAENGFVAIQPDHLDSSAFGLPANDQRLVPNWRYRVEDMHAVIDHLDEIAAAVPGLTGRIDRHRIIVAGHSYGGHTVQALLGARTTDPATDEMVDLSDARILAGIIIAGPGGGDRDLTPEAQIHHRYLDVDWSTMSPPALILAGDQDAPGMSTRDWRWHLDPYERSRAGNKCLALLHGADHYLGGIQGPGRAATSDESPERVSYIHRLTLRYLQLVSRGVRAPTPADMDVGDATNAILCR